MAEPPTGVKIAPARRTAPTCFQLKPDGTSTRRFVHYTQDTEQDGTLRAWCREAFNLATIEATSQPHTPPKPGQAIPGPACVLCHLRRMAAQDREKDARGETVRLSASDRYLLWLLLQADWIRESAQQGIADGSLTKAEHDALADVYHQLSQCVRERGEHIFGTQVINTGEQEEC